MLNTITTRPADFPYLAEYGSRYVREAHATREVLATATGAIHGFPQIRFLYTTAGYEIAGSVMRWTDAGWLVHWTDYDGAIHGRRFAEANEDAARTYFADLTDAAKVAAMRAENAAYAAREADINAECERRASSIRIDVFKSRMYRSGWQYTVDYPGMRETGALLKTKREAEQHARKALMHRLYCEIA